MPRLVLTAHLAGLLDATEMEFDGERVRDVLERLFDQYPKLRSYLLEDTGRLRKHVNVFIDGQPIRDRLQLSDAVGPEGEVYVLQALSGG